MTISAELIAIAILGVSLVSLGWKVTGDLRQEIHLVRSDVAKLGDRIDFRALWDKLIYINNLPIPLRYGSPQYTHRFESDFGGPSWP